ncbi:Glutathione S-transferase S1 [Mortierella claussenii]|nr:Glutathione S-transferase S1 [Mortierella claussenii]
MTPQPHNRPKLTYKSADPSLTSYEKSVILKDTDEKDLSYTFLYWDIASVGSTSRDILKYANANCTFVEPDEGWEKGKVATVFSVLPILTITAPGNKELIISESMVIDVFLAERFGLLGENKWESLTIQSFYSNIHYLRERTFSEVTDVPKELRKRIRDEFLTITLKKFLEDHEFHLKENGDNGHYVGDKLSLADLHLANTIHFYSTLPWGKKALDEFKKYEAVWKVKETVDKVPALKAWYASDEFKRYEYGSIKWYERFVVPGEEPTKE